MSAATQTQTIDAPQVDVLSEQDLSHATGGVPGTADGDSFAVPPLTDEDLTGVVGGGCDPVTAPDVPLPSHITDPAGGQSVGDFLG